MNSEVSTKRAILWPRNGARSGWFAALLLVLALPSVALAHSPQSGTLQPQKYVQAGSSGARLFNLPDPKGQVVLKAEPSTPLAVYGSYAEGRYLKVAAPGGVKVWVYGKYVQESQRPGWVELTGSYVNMRPMPRSQDSYPLGQLDRGDRLIFIKRADPSKPMAEDWVQVYSPPGTMSYVLAAETIALPAGVDASARWSGAVAAARKSQEGGVTPLPVEAAGTTSETVPAEAQAGSPVGVFGALNAAEKHANEELAKDAPDFAGVILAYEAVLALGPDAPTRTLVNQRIEKVRMHEELAEIRRDIAAAEEERQRKLDEVQERIREANRGRDPLWGRFQTRGWLERQRKDGEKIYLVRWGSEFIAQVECRTGRYDLDLFQGFEIGVRGFPLRAAPSDGGYPLIDIDRIEVISARYVHGG